MSLSRSWLFASLVIAGTFVACTRETTSTEQPAQSAQSQPPAQIPAQQLNPPSQPATAAEAPAPAPTEQPVERTPRSRRPATKAGEPERPGVTRTERPLDATTPRTDPGQRAAVENRPPDPPPPPRTATLDTGSTITVRTTSLLSTATALSGDRFSATLEKPITEGSWVIAPRGARVEGIVAESTKGGRVKGKAFLTLRLTSITTADGDALRVETASVKEEAKSQVKKDATKVGIATGIGAAIGAIAGGGKGAAIGAAAGAAGGGGMVAATRGEAAEIPSETVLNFELASPVRVTERR